MIVVATTNAFAQAEKPLRIGVLTDLSGPYSANSGAGTVAAVKLAVEDFAGKIGSTPIEVLVADHLQKPDLALSIARNWIDIDDVAAIIDVNNSAAALAVSDLVQQKNRVMLTGAATAALSDDKCSPNTVQWDGNTYTYATGTSVTVVEEGGTKWYYLTVGYALGQDLTAKSSAAVIKAGGKVVGNSPHPLGTSDFSSYLLQAQSSGANVIGLSNTNPLK